MEAASGSCKGDLLAILWLYLADWHSDFYSSHVSLGFTHLTYYYSDSIVGPSPIESRVCCSISSIAGWFQACAWMFTSSSWRINEGIFMFPDPYPWWVTCPLKMLFISEIFDSLDIQKFLCIFFSSYPASLYKWPLFCKNSIYERTLFEDFEESLLQCCHGWWKTW